MDTATQIEIVSGGALVTLVIVRLLKEDVTFLPTVPKQYRGWLIMALTMVSATLQAKLGNLAWSDAITNAVSSALAAMLGHEVVVNNLRGGVDLPVPGVPAPVPTPLVEPPVEVKPVPEVVKEVETAIVGTKLEVVTVAAKEKGPEADPVPEVASKAQD